MKNKLLKALSRAIVIADFKSVEKKFIEQNADKEEIQRYLDLFKELKSNQRIQSIENKNIDTWGKRTWEEFKEFVDNLKSEKSKAEEKKIKKMEGAELVAEDDNWRIYRITSHDACKIYGSGTKWCITEPSSTWWDKYAKRSTFYFILSKNRDSTDPWYKIAAQVGRKGKKTYWDAVDKNHSHLPNDLNMVKFDFTFTGEENQTDIESLIADIEDYALDQVEYYTDPNGDYADYVYDQEIELKYVDAYVQGGLDILEGLCGDLGLDFIDTVKNDTTKLEHETSYYTNSNEIARFSIGDQESELPDELLDALRDLSTEEQTEVLRGLTSGYPNIEHGTISVLGDNDSFVLIIDEDLLAEKIEELQENKAITDEEDLSTVDKTVLTAKSPSSRIKAIEKTDNQEILEQAYKEDKVKDVRLAAASKIENQKLLDEIVLNKEEDDKVKIAAIENKNFDNDDLLKKLVEKYSLGEDPDRQDIQGHDDNSGDSVSWSIYTTSLKKIKDMKWLNKYALKRRVGSSVREELVERITKEMGGKKTKAYVDYLKKLAAIMIEDNQRESLGAILTNLPDSEQTFFKEVALFENVSDHWQHGREKGVRETALSRIKDEDFLKKYIAKNIKNIDKDSGIIKAALAGIKDQKYLEKCLADKKFDPVGSTLVKLVDNDRLVADHILRVDGGNLLTDSKIKDQKILQELILEPKFYEWYKQELVNRLDVTSLQALTKKLPKAITKPIDLADIYRYMYERAKELKNKQLEDKLFVMHKQYALRKS